MQNIAEVVGAWVVAANAHNAERLASLYSPEAQLLYTWGELLNGQESINAHFVDFFRAFPTWRKEPYSLIHGYHDWAVLEWQARATFDGPYHDAAPTGRSFQLRGCGVFHIVEGQIRLHRRYLDRKEWYRQMGL
jgi:ketosteroid isomerase-like protein